MSKSKKSASKKSAKKTMMAVAPAPQSMPEAVGAAPKPIIRAIRVTAELLAAAKAYKRDKGVSFYQLGLDAISDRLAREGYLDAKKVAAE